MTKWKYYLRDLLYDAGESDHPYCPKCDATMNFFGHDENGDFPIGEGHWDCPNCGFTFYEKNVPY